MSGRRVRWQWVMGFALGVVVTPPLGAPDLDHAAKYGSKCDAHNTVAQRSGAGQVGADPVAANEFSPCVTITEA